MLEEKIWVLRASRLGQFGLSAFVSLLGILGIPVLGVSLAHIIAVGIFSAIVWVVWLSAWGAWIALVVYYWSHMWETLMDFE